MVSMSLYVPASSAPLLGVVMTFQVQDDLGNVVTVPSPYTADLFVTGLAAISGADNITIGAGSTIGGNVWLTHSVPANSNVSQAQMRSGSGCD